MFKFYNPNPIVARVGDCVIRAICKATNKKWEEVYNDLCDFGFNMADMPSANSVWGAYLRYLGFNRYVVSTEYPDSYTVYDFAEDNKNGTYILALSGHVVCVQDGDYYDTWDSGDEVPIYYWCKEE